MHRAGRGGAFGASIRGRPERWRAAAGHDGSRPRSGAAADGPGRDHCVPGPPAQGRRDAPSPPCRTRNPPCRPACPRTTSNSRSGRPIASGSFRTAVRWQPERRRTSCSAAHSRRLSPARESTSIVHEANSRCTGISWARWNSSADGLARYWTARTLEREGVHVWEGDGRAPQIRVVVPVGEGGEWSVSGGGAPVRHPRLYDLAQDLRARFQSLAREASEASR